MSTQQPSGSEDPAVFSKRFWWILFAACAGAILLGLFWPGRRQTPAETDAALASSEKVETAEPKKAAAFDRERWLSRNASAGPAPSAEEIVAGKLAKFVQSRRDLARAMAKRKGAAVPDEVEQFFDALQRGNWEEIERQFNALGKRSGQYDGSTHAAELDPVWSAVLDAYGAAEQVHEWPAQKLLDYGNAILDSLKPGMVYVGGTDHGRWVPTLLNETSGQEPHIVITQNALADARYAEYLGDLYGDRFAALTPEDSKRAFQEYVADAQRRLEHDEQFPNEPKQLRHGEEVKVVDGKVQVSGQVAVMSINERLLQTIMGKNPDLRFAVEESVPLPGTYADALPLGPLMELGARDEQNSFTPERAAQSLDYWQTVAQQILADPEALGSTYTLKSYSHDAVAAANLLAGHNFVAEAEQAYRLAAQLWPGNPETAAGLADVLARSGRPEAANQTLAEFDQRFPKERKNLEKLSGAARILWSAGATP